MILIVQEVVERPDAPYLVVVLPKREIQFRRNGGSREPCSMSFFTHILALLQESNGFGIMDPPT